MASALDWKSAATGEVVERLGTSIDEGLSSDEVVRRRGRYGPNTLREGKKTSILERFAGQFRNVLIYILLIAALVSGALGELTDAIVIAAIVLLNAVIGVIQESRAEEAIAALQKLSTPKALVRRDGAVREVDSAEIVPGDVVILEAGRVVPCDLRLVETANLKVEESALTGESVPVEKAASAELPAEGVALGDQVTMAFSSTIVTYGRGSGVAVGTGMDTELGKIAGMLEAQGQETTPLQERLERFGRFLGFLILGICAIMFGVGILQLLLRSGRIPTDSLLELFLTAVSLAVAAIPEGLPAIVTVVLAIGVQQMSRKNAIVRKLPAVETLGSVTIVCSDKTGTLTQNRMTVTRFLAGQGDVQPLDDLQADDPVSARLLRTIVHCNDATYGSPGAEGTGDPTEIALLVAGNRFGVTKEALLAERPRIGERPFDSERKMMSTVGSAPGGESATVYTKGALDSLLPLCTRIATPEGEREITAEDRERLQEAAAAMSDEALRVLGAADREVREADREVREADREVGGDEAGPGELERDLCFVGLVGMIDPPRLEVKDSIRACKRAGITPVMITGDHRNTAFAIARELGIADARSQTIGGTELDDIDDAELAQRVPHLRVFARVSPEHKVRIVEAFKANGQLVSMTGDGVNDAPSLQSADIGVAMGITGTDVAKGASDMVLTDDNFQTIVSAIEAGRNIYANIKKAITFLLSCNAGEIVAIFTAILVGWRSPLLPIHILWVNLITDSLPALGLGMDAGDPHALAKPPRNPEESIFAGGTGLSVILNGFVIGAITLVAFRIGSAMYADSLVHARTMAFVVLAMSQLFHAFDVRDNAESIFTLGLFSNKWLWLALGVGAALQWLVITVPVFASLFEVFPLLPIDWAIAVGLALVPVLVNETVKVVIRMRSAV
ncbi:MAG: cation-translocating P-type ATPase [Spirochaetales bacterium]